MSLFSVPGWDNGIVPVPPGKGRGKRKRSDKAPSGASSSTSTNLNLQALMREMRLENNGSERKHKTHLEKLSIPGRKDTLTRKRSRMDPPQSPAKTSQEATRKTEPPRPPKRLRREESDVLPPSSAGDGEEDPSTVLSRIKSKKKKSKQQRKAELANILKDRETAVSPPPSSILDMQSDVTEPVAERPSSPPPDLNHTGLASSSSAELDGLTPSQRDMKAKLSGSRFRMINELLYKSDGAASLRMMQQDPDVYKDYHSGFRRQVLSWPVNPVTYFTSSISSTYSAESTVIADLGCGDASLAKNLSPRGFRVLSYDLVSDGEWVTEADLCNHIPLPGNIDDLGGSTAQIVDVAVFSLSLMNTNWIKSVKEARRILKTGGRMKIAEVTSRLKSKKAFTSLIATLGFKLIETTDPNTHFCVFEFEKIKRGPLSKKDWAQIEAKATDLLKPCEYKRR
ncbi:methyltransferase-domain-containing protein [Cantharellus anzutake]|uniref:methyltransferase-domain-containing protein n=1 Tax=Cantharellus anzutake TaxID=1750568 RepID=UPI001904C7F1|nr:methyltransferase-domain-containing protein [Cantharellus anzutake]KAF8324484.1 methyltransferase-domain-containing protein [Cantharellus anzutake]